MKRCKTGIYDLAGTCDLKSEAVDTSGQHEDIEKGAQLSLRDRVRTGDVWRKVRDKHGQQRRFGPLIRMAEDNRYIDLWRNCKKTQQVEAPKNVIHCMYDIVIVLLLLAF